MYDRRITASEATLAGLDDHLMIVRSLLSTLQEFAVAKRSCVAPQHDIPSPAAQALAVRYAAASSITRRRFDAQLREAETVARIGFGVIAGRHDRGDPGTIAAARFLGNSISSTLQRLEKLLAPQAIRASGTIAPLNHLR